MALLSLALGILATLFRAAIRMVVHSEQKDVELRDAVACCQQIRLDVESAIIITSPLAGTPSSSIVLVRMNPFDENLSIPLLNASSAWVPHPGNFRWDITYNFTAPRVIRTVTQPGGIPWQSTLAGTLSGMQCVINADAYSQPLSARIEVKAGTPVRTVQLEFPIHVPPQVVL